MPGRRIHLRLRAWKEKRRHLADDIVAFWRESERPPSLEPALARARATTPNLSLCRSQIPPENDQRIQIEHIQPFTGRQTTKAIAWTGEIQAFIAALTDHMHHLMGVVFVKQYHLQRKMGGRKRNSAIREPPRTRFEDLHPRTVSHTQTRAPRSRVSCYTNVHGGDTSISSKIKQL